MTKKHIHFIGIGGIGMSGLAQIAMQHGHKVSGCDLHINQQTVAYLMQHGCTIGHHGQDSCFDTSITSMVYSSDTERPMPEKESASARCVNIIHRSQFLAQLMLPQTGIAITGAHGKTTTTAMTAHIFLKLNLDPTVIVGGIMPLLKNNAHTGTSQFLIAEADESDRSMLNLPAAIKVITNIDFEHVDTYNTIEDVQATFLRFLNNDQDKAIAHALCIDNKETKQILHHVQVPFMTYGFNDDADIQATDVVLHPFSSTFTVHDKKHALSVQCTLGVPGSYNILNALGALTAASIAGYSIRCTASTLASFCSVDRRFTRRGSYKNALIIDDYAHHPEEIKNILKTARACTKDKLIVVFQPHRFTRVAGLWNDFITLFQQDTMIDHLFITDIYGAGEKVIETVDSKKLVAAINKKKCIYIANNTDALTAQLPLVSAQDIILFLGAGDISKRSIELVNY